MAEDKLLNVSYGILDEKGRLVLDGGVPMLFKTKKDAKDSFIPEEGETIQKVSIYAA